MNTENLTMNGAWYVRTNKTRLLMLGWKNSNGEVSLNGVVPYYPANSNFEEEQISPAPSESLRGPEPSKFSI